jgi:hypothetical protein
MTKIKAGGPSASLFGVAVTLMATGLTFPLHGLPKRPTPR